ncbi:MAG: hypothetical protein LZF60_360084 [Nitrospira sp.]|nr:MAG: hypothetical protein LZF60_360084 [Nitrospira sp.]
MRAGDIRQARSEIEPLAGGLIDPVQVASLSKMWMIPVGNPYTMRNGKSHSFKPGGDHGKSEGRFNGGGCGRGLQCHALGSRGLVARG